MIVINNYITLQQHIQLLEEKQQLQMVVLKLNLENVYESLQPSNIIKSTIHNVVASTDLKKNIFSTIVGVAGGFISKRILFGPSHSIVKTILGTVLQLAMTSFVSNKAAELVSEETVTKPKIDSFISERNHSKFL